MESSLLLRVGFIVLSIALLGVMSWPLRSCKLFLYGAIWMAGTALIAGLGLLANFTVSPPRVSLIFIPALIATVVLAFTSLGTRMMALPLRYVIGFQSFRIIVEFLIHRAVDEGVAPPQMTWTGMNFDIVTGATALILAPFVHRAPVWLLWAWNIMGSLLLAWIVGVAILSFPSPFQQLKPDNT